MLRLRSIPNRAISRVAVLVIAFKKERSRTLPCNVAGKCGLFSKPDSHRIASITPHRPMRSGS